MLSIAVKLFPPGEAVQALATEREAQLRFHPARIFLFLLLWCATPCVLAQFVERPSAPWLPGAAPGRAPSEAVNGQPVLVDRIVAVVNNEVITRRDLDERIGVVLRQLQKQQNPRIPPREVIERQVLERMIADKAQLQFARDIGLQVDDRTVDAAIGRIAENNKLTAGQFRAALEQDGISYSKFRQDIREEITLARVREKEVDSRIQVSESEIDNFLEDPQNKAGTAAIEYNISHILVRVADQPSPEQVSARLKRAQEAHARAKGGQDFAELAVLYSDAPEGLKGGDMGWRSHERLPELFARALAGIKPGEVTDILRSPAGFHILKLKEKRGGVGSALTVEQTKVRHILVRINELISEAEARRKLGLLRERVIEGADFAELARLNSDDGSAAKGGDLGWVSRGDLVPDFERAMNALKLGEVSEPVKSQFGLHLIQVLDRRIADVTGDRKRAEARKALRERKADEAYQEWVRSIRDRAFVDIRLEDR